jgi:hypothetical protein
MSSTTSSFDNDGLYAGFLECCYAECEGNTIPFSKAAFTEQSNKKLSSVALAQARGEPQSHLGAEYATVLVPCIPATDVEIKFESQKAREAALQSAVPTFLQRPLVKVPVSLQTDRKGSSSSSNSSCTAKLGLRSGIRSGLLKGDNGTWYRLKGCGNNDEGFILQTVTKKSVSVNIRGCAFRWTAARELFMTTLIGEALAAESYLAGNKSVCLYEYKLPESEPLPAITRVCGVFETLGDRRLSDHVLSGLECMLHLLVARCEPSELEALFNPMRCMEGLTPPDQLVTPTWLAIVTGTDEGLAELQKHSNVVAELVPTADDCPPRCSEELRAVWEECCGVLSAFHEARPGVCVIGELYHKLGYDCGVVMRVMQDAKISWGTYTDKIGTHCNAHSNNMLVMSEAQAGESKRAQVLAPVDFDMAFTQGSHVFESDEKFAYWLGLEQQMFKMALAGDPECSTGVASSAVNTQTVPEHARQSTEAMRWALRDTLMVGYARGMDDQQCALEWGDSLFHAMYALIRLALIQTWDVIA